MYSLAMKRKADAAAKRKAAEEQRLARARSDAFYIEVYGKTRDQLSESGRMNATMREGGHGAMRPHTVQDGSQLGGEGSLGGMKHSASAPPRTAGARPTNSAMARGNGTRSAAQLGGAGEMAQKRLGGPRSAARRERADSSRTIDAIHEHAVMTTDVTEEALPEMGAEGSLFNIGGSLISTSVHRTGGVKVRTAKDERPPLVRLDGTYPGTGEHTPMNHAFRDRDRSRELGPGFISGQPPVKARAAFKGGGRRDEAATERLRAAQASLPNLWSDYAGLGHSGEWEGGAKALKLRERQRKAELAHDYMAIGGNKGAYDPKKVWKGGGIVDEEATRELIKSRSHRILRHPSTTKWEAAEVIEEAEDAGLVAVGKHATATEKLRSSGSFRSFRSLKSTGSMRKLPLVPAGSFRQLPLTHKGSVRNLAVAAGDAEGSQRGLLTATSASSFMTRKQLKTAASSSSGNLLGMAGGASTGRTSPEGGDGGASEGPAGAWGDGIESGSGARAVLRRGPSPLGPSGSSGALQPASGVGGGFGYRPDGSFSPPPLMRAGPDTPAGDEEDEERRGLSSTGSVLRIVRPEKGEHVGPPVLDHYRKSHWRTENKDKWISQRGFQFKKPPKVFHSHAIDFLL